jgi:hypothetical protein
MINTKRKYIVSSSLTETSACAIKFIALPFLSLSSTRFGWYKTAMMEERKKMTCHKIGLEQYK